jgi:hypothetical protein
MSSKRNKYDRDEHKKDVADYIQTSQQNAHDLNKFEKFAERNSQHLDQHARYTGLPLLIAFISILVTFLMDTLPLGTRVFAGIVSIISFVVFIYRCIKTG